MSVFGVHSHGIFLVDNLMVRRNECRENELMLLENLVTRRVSIVREIKAVVDLVKDPPSRDL